MSQAPSSQESPENDIMRRIMEALPEINEESLDKTEMQEAIRRDALKIAENYLIDNLQPHWSPDGTGDDGFLFFDEDSHGTDELTNILSDAILEAMEELWEDYDGDLKQIQVIMLSPARKTFFRAFLDKLKAGIHEARSKMYRQKVKNLLAHLEDLEIKVEEGERDEEMDLLYTKTKLGRRKFVKEFEAAKALNMPLAAILFDIDHFKGVNDGFSYKMGDLALKHIGKILKRSIRNAILARIGGEEVAAIAIDADVNGGCNAAERARENVENEPLYAVYAIDENNNPVGLPIDVGQSGYDSILSKANAQDADAKVEILNSTTDEKGRETIIFRDRRKKRRQEDADQPATDRRSGDISMEGEERRVGEERREKNIIRMVLCKIPLTISAAVSDCTDADQVTVDENMLHEPIFEDLLAENGDGATPAEDPTKTIVMQIVGPANTDLKLAKKLHNRPVGKIIEEVQRLLSDISITPDEEALLLAKDDNITSTMPNNEGVEETIPDPTFMAKLIKSRDSWKLTHDIAGGVPYGTEELKKIERAIFLLGERNQIWREGERYAAVV